MSKSSEDRRNFQSFKLRHIFQRSPDTVLNNTRARVDNSGYRYIIMELPWDRIPILLNMKKQEIEHLKNVLVVRPYSPEKDAEIFAKVFNTILITSPDPYRPITIEEAKIFSSNGTFLAFLYHEPAGFAALTIEDTPEGKIGVIAGIGVMPKFRGKKIALAIAIAVVDWFQKIGVKKLQCEVYENNDVSYRFISSLGFHKVGEMYLDKDITENPVKKLQN